VEREPITTANVDQALEGELLSTAEHEVILHAERPVVTTETVPVERVRLSKDTVAGETTVTGEVRHEQIDTETDPER
jgi:stress response protein YsnF